MDEITRPDPLSFENLGGGAAREMVNIALGRVFTNALDPNTIATYKRKIYLEITVTPTENRDAFTADYAVREKLAPHKPFRTTGFVGKNAQGRPEARELNSDQLRLFPEERKPILINVGKGGSDD